MIRIFKVPEYRIVVPGKAISFRSPKAENYKKKIKILAKKIFHHPLSDHYIEVYIDYFHTKKRRVDMDNIAKCILDALNKVAYIDDRYVHLQRATAYWIKEIIKISNAPVDIVKPLARYDEYLLIRIRNYDKKDK
jgi:Holliday junction resolvase RusA-like endonuclease